MHSQSRNIYKVHFGEKILTFLFNFFNIKSPCEKEIDHFKINLKNFKNFYCDLYFKVEKERIY